MGIELPPELRDVAARAGARWPAADEDLMRDSATAWREAATSLDALTRNADTVAQGALNSFDGEAAQAAGREWNGFIADDGPLPATAKQCRANADRLDHAAEQISTAKVELVRELVSLAKQTDAAEQAAATGNPQALAGLDAALSGAAANVARVHETLSTALDSGVPAAAEQASGALAEVGATAGHTLEPESAVDGAEPGDVGAVIEEAERGVAETVGGAHDTVREAVPEGGFGAPAAPPAPGWQPGMAEAGTGPIPVIGSGGHAGWRPDEAPNTAPQASHAAWASPPVQQPQAPAPGFNPPQPPPPQQQGGYAVAGGPAAPPPQQGVAAVRPPQPPPVNRAPMAFGQAGPAPQPPGGQPQHVQNQPASHQQVQRGALRPLPPQAQPPQSPAAPEPQQRPLRHGPRNADVVAFVLHQFPIGYMPVAADQASRQLPVHDAPENREGLNFPPQDHPRSDLVDDTDALRRAQNTALYDEARRNRAEPPEPATAPEELLASHEPLGELSELDWERRYEIRDGEHTRHRWPHADEFPEGGFEPGEAVVLEPDAVIDLFGTGDGRLFCAAATPFAHRSLPPAHAERDYRRYRLLRPLPVWRSVAAPWFEQPGRGVRYRTTYPAADLVGLGYLVELTKSRELSEASTLRLVLTGTTDGEPPPDQHDRQQESPR